MSAAPNYKNRKSTTAAILEVIKPGDVVNQVGERKWWQFWLAITYAAIRWYQRKLFGKGSNWKDVHTMLYFDEENTFSVEMPRATLKPLREYCLSNLSIYRLRLLKLSPGHIKTLKAAAQSMVGEGYDIGQLLDIAVCGLLGYDHRRVLSIFDFGRKKKVCSVGVRIALEYLGAFRPETTGKWLFKTLNPEKWPPEAIQKYKGTDVEATSPAHFANSDYFSCEFGLVARFKNGKQVFPK